MATKRKSTTAIVAGVTAAALLLGGTFAWTSISQMALNESAGIVNVGGRLHDDFDGKNKDVYVENFTDPLNGGQPIYARVRLDEYMEVGKDAGGIDVDQDGSIDAVPVINGTKRDEVTTWKPHVPSDSCEICESGDTCLIHDHWEWAMGGQTTFMPTFNKDKDSLAADINGTYHGTIDTDKVYYDDYVVYTTTLEDGVNNNIAEADKEAHEGEIYSVIGTEYYDDDTDTEDNNGTRQVDGVTHTAKDTATAEVMTMQEWIAAGSNPGNYWVYDDDGWAYWANPIMPGEATGLLLNGIDMTKNPGEKCYYAINVVGQFATVSDWEYFTDGGVPSDEAMTLLETVSKNVATVTVTNVDGKTAVNPGETVRFSASVSLPSDAATLAAGDFEWSVLDTEFKEVTSSTITANDDGTVSLNVGADEKNFELIIAARSTTYNGAMGMSAVAVNVVEEFDIATTFSLTNNLNAPSYAVFTGDKDSVYTMYLVRTRDDITTSPESHMINNEQVTEVYSGDGGWKSKRGASGPVNVDYIDKVVFVNKMQPTDTSFWFYGFRYLESIEGMAENLDTSKVTDMEEMFGFVNEWRDDIITLDISAFDTSKVTNMNYMFAGAKCIFNGIEDLNTSSCTSMGWTFQGYEYLEEIDLSKWDVSNVTIFQQMFDEAGFKSIVGAENWDVSSATDMSYMFDACNNLILDCSKWDVTNVRYYNGFNDNAPNVTAPTWVN